MTKFNPWPRAKTTTFTSEASYLYSVYWLYSINDHIYKKVTHIELLVIKLVE